ncbi:MAG TPA: acetylxylan esterase [Opitutaceae bacterium]|nr:acetylxylan esterase [Opitutaceae bacterium]
MLLLTGAPPLAAATLRRGEAQTPAAAREELAAFAATFDDAAAWKRRAEDIRRGILRGAGLDPLPARSPLQPLLGPVQQRAGYSVQPVAFESLRGFFVTAALYRPADAAGRRMPAVLIFHGHGDPATAGRYHESKQKLGATLARMGATALTVNMVGYGDSDQYPHRGDKTLALQLWNGIRALDFLESLPEVDRSRLAVTGESGGGTQTFLLTAVDRRVAAAAPVVMVSAHFFGGCSCESGMPIHQSDAHLTNNAEIAALAAPRPLLLVSDGKDWTRFNPDVEFPYVKRVYALLGAPEAVANVHLADEGHDYGPSKRAAVYRFLAHHFGLPPPPSEDDITLESVETLRLFSPSHPRPAHAVADPGVVEAFLSAR